MAIRIDMEGKVVTQTYVSSRSPPDGPSHSIGCRRCRAITLDSVE